MPRYVVLAQSEITAHALGAWLTLLGEAPLATAGGRIVDSRCIVLDASEVFRASGVEGFERAAAATRSALAEADDEPLTAFVDAVHARVLDPLSDSGGWNTIVAMLVLAFPEIRWMFGVVSFPPEWTDWHGLVTSLTKPFRDPTMDATGLRDWVRQRVNARPGQKEPLLSQRPKTAAAIDEELDYAVFHAYTAYRFGFRADAVTSWALMEELFVKGSQPHGRYLLLEDVSLSFPDRPTHKHLSDFRQERAENCPKLGYANQGWEDSRFRIVVTAGRSFYLHREQLKTFLEEHKPGRYEVVPKPSGGMFDLWTKAALFDRLPRQSDDDVSGLAPGFKSPLREPESIDSPHSAPGKLMLIARHLVNRAGGLHKDASSVADYIRGAIFANDALELLGGRTPTLAAEALGLKHYFEVSAECRFSGVEYHIHLEARVREIQRDVKMIGRWFNHDEDSERGAMNAEMHILRDLMRVFRDHGLFDEEQYLMNRVRDLHNTLWIRRPGPTDRRNPGKRRQSPWRSMCWPILRYSEFLLSSPRNFCLSLGLWIGGLTAVFWVLRRSDNMLTHHGELGPVLDSFSRALSAFIGSEPLTVTGVVLPLLTAVSIFAGLAHLGIFISYLYTLVSRR